MTSKGNSTFKFRLSRRAERYLKRLNKKARERIACAIENICQNPTYGPHIRPLESAKEDYRYDIGNLRILYSVNLEQKIIDIDNIGPRGDIYKK